MNTIRCPICNELLPESALYCAGCGESMTSPGHKSIHYRIDQVQDRQPKAERPLQVDAPKRAITLKLSQFHSLSDDKDSMPSESVTDVARPVMVASAPRKRSGAQTTPLQRSRRSPRGHASDSEWQELKRPSTWHKDVAPSPNRAKAAPPPPRPVPSRVPMLKTWRMRLRRLPPVIFLWVSLLLLILVVFGGIFGIVVTIGRGIDNRTRHNSELSLQVSPNSAAVGATVMLSGANFSPYGQIGLSRDASIPIMDTSNTSIVEADGSGNFSDTIAITPDWESGSHTLNAEDATRHKVASFSITVTDHATSLRPAHLRISMDALDLGSGDQVTNTMKTITLSNVGGGQISWQSNSTQPWLVLSPSSGTFFSGHHAQITAAIDRSKLNPGSYNAQINIMSNAGDGKVPVKAGVIPLLPEHAAALQLTPALLSFTAADGGMSPSTQMVTISNPGLQQVKWQATTNVDWLSASPQSAVIDPSSSIPVTIAVNTSTLLPGTYSGVVTFSAQGSALVTGNPQSLPVTITVLPQCSLQVSPGMVSFAGVYQQSLPAPKMINISTSCTTPTVWHAVSNADWLTIDASSGKTPSTPLIAINAPDLKPGTYNSSIIFSSAAGTQTLPVTFTLVQGTIPLVATAPDVMVFSGVSGQANPLPQKMSIANNGNSGAVTWKAQATTAIGGNWLSVSPASGTLIAYQSAVLSITTTVLPSLLPGTYRGTITITGVDEARHTVLGSPQTIPISLIVKPGCSIAAPTQLSFASSAGQPGPSPQQFAILASTACINPLNWTATVATTSGGNWLTATTTGTATPVNSGIVTVGIASTNLKTGNYAGTVTITATDSVTRQVIGPPLVVPVVFSMQPSCILQAPSLIHAAFTAQAGTNPATTTFTVSVAGTCTGSVTITPTVTYGSKTGGWLTVTPDASSVLPGGIMTFTVTPTSTHLPAGTFTASISLTATNNGIAMVSSPQAVSVILSVTPRPVPVATPSPTPTPAPTSMPATSTTPVA